MGWEAPPSLHQLYCVKILSCIMSRKNKEKGGGRWVAAAFARFAWVSCPSPTEVYPCLDGAQLPLQGLPYDVGGVSLIHNQRLYCIDTVLC